MVEIKHTRHTGKSEYTLVNNKTGDKYTGIGRSKNEVCAAMGVKPHAVYVGCNRPITEEVVVLTQLTMPDMVELHQQYPNLTAINPISDEEGSYYGITSDDGLCFCPAEMAFVVYGEPTGY